MTCAPYHGRLRLARRDILTSSLLHPGILRAHTLSKLSSVNNLQSLTFSFNRFGRRQLSKLTSISLSVLNVVVSSCGVVVTAFRASQRVGSDESDVAASNESVYINVSV